ncbi:MAG: hypothetical protein MJA29_03425, partial [Candidatus Omnitrophica bacterium]|nr:hypothetical protein [Candidatus Omnitrophota bacterium]
MSKGQPGGLRSRSSKLVYLLEGSSGGALSFTLKFQQYRSNYIKYQVGIRLAKKTVTRTLKFF